MATDRAVSLMTTSWYRDNKQEVRRWLEEHDAPDPDDEEEDEYEDD